jgi:alanine-glyoxylate transaminase/serine-glyoxylate transaminase/serine-pyruvate transaminase
MSKSDNSKNPVTTKLLMGPGPSNVNKKVYDALAKPIIGHLDPDFLGIMDETVQMLREVFTTSNKLTIPISGTGSSGMEASFVNVVEREDKVIICVNGIFGERMADVASRYGAEVVRVDEEWGRVIEPSKIIDVLKKHPDTKVLSIVHAETSTGAMQPIEEIGAYIKDSETLLLVDSVTSLAGCELKIDDWNIDICYSGTQKCLSVPPGLSPVTFSDKAIDVIESRSSKIESWYLDLSMIRKYWGSERIYHHTAPISMIYALREGLKIVLNEGLEERYKRHQMVGDYFEEKIKELGFDLFAQEGFRLPMLVSIILPDGIDDASVRSKLLNDYGIEIGVGLGKTRGQIWRVGLMGETSTKQNVDIFTNALKEIVG